jgi:hypothetical protein
MYQQNQTTSDPANPKSQAPNSKENGDNIKDADAEEVK